MGKKSSARGETPNTFDPFQQVVAAAYNGGDHACQTPENINDCADTLLTFLMRELSEKEECESIEEAISRLDVAIRELEEVRSAFQAKLPS